MFRNPRQMRRWIVIAVAIGLFCFSAAWAKKPVKPEKPDPGSNGGGVIYFNYDGDLYTMNDDGSGILPAADFPTGFGVWGDSSRQLHAEKRWFAQMMDVPGGNYPDFNPDGTYKYGTNCRILVVLSDGGDAVPLWIDAGLEPLEQPKWTVGDGYLSWVGRRWDIDPDSDSYGEVLEGGLYATELAFDTTGNITGLAEPSVLLVPFSPLIPSDTCRPTGDYSPGPDMRGHDWAPDGIHFVFDAISAEELRIGQVGGGFTTLLSDSLPCIRSARWSPAGDKIIFKSRADLMVINVDGSGLKTLVRSSPKWSLGSVVWSPTGSHLLHHHWDNTWQDSYIVRITATGRDKTRLTDESMGWGIPGVAPQALGWR